MSSFINSPKHFRSVEDYLCMQAMNNRIYSLRQLTTVKNGLYGFPRSEEIEDFINTLSELQVVCVCLQYRRHKSGGLDKEIQVNKEFVKIKTSLERLTEAGAYKALSCIRYQIEVEHLKELRELTPEEAKAMKVLTDIIHELAEMIVHETADYKKATYSIE